MDVVEVVAVDEEVQDSQPVEEVETTSPEEETPEASDQAEVSDELEGEQDQPEAVEEGAEPEDNKEVNFRKLREVNDTLKIELDSLKQQFERQQASQEQAQSVDVNALNAHLAQMQDNIEDLRLDGKHIEAAKLDRQRTAIIDEYDKFNEQQAELSKRQEVNQTTEQYRKQSLESFDEASVFLAKEKGIPSELFDEMGKVFYDTVQSDKLFARQFIETLERQGPVHAASFAYDKVKSITDTKQASLAAKKAEKDAAKGKQVAGGGAAITGTMKSYQALLNLGSAQVASYKKSNPKHYDKLLDAHMK